MARKAAPSNFFQTFVRKHPEEIKVGAACAAVALLFTHGLPLYDEDYSRWMAQANGGFFKLLGRLILPFTAEPQTWGYRDLPVQALLYKIYSTIFGDWGFAYFAIKSLVFGGLCGALYHWMGKLGVTKSIRLFAVAIFALSTNTVASLVQHSDFRVYSQLLMVVTMLWAMAFIEKGPSSMSVYAKGVQNIPVAFRNFLITFFCLVYFGSKLGTDMRMVPVVLLAHLYLFKREKATVYAAPFGIALAATLPWSTYMFKHLPPFIPGAAGYTGTTYAHFSIGRVIEFLFSDIHAIRMAPLSVLGGVGLLVTLAAVVYAGYRVYREQLDQPDQRWGFFLVWFGVALLALGSAPRADHNYQLRHTMLILVPGILLFAMAAQAAQKEFANTVWFKPAFASVLALQLALHVVHDAQFRRDMGRTMVAVSNLYSHAEANYPNAQLLLAQGFEDYGFRSSAPVIAGKKRIVQGDDVANYPAGNTLMASWGSTLDARMTVAHTASGCGSSVFDVIFRCGASDGAVLLKYVGTHPEIAQADQADRSGNLAGAFDIMENLLKKDPTNHGAAFIQGLYSYRLSRTDRMGEIYDQIGPYFPWHVAVVYNWGLAKQAIGKFPEALQHFERAYTMAPRDYAVGYNLADTYQRVGKKSRALATIDTMLQVYPNDGSMQRSREEWAKK